MKSNYLFRLFVRNKTGFYGVLLLSLLAYDVVILSFNNTKHRKTCNKTQIPVFEKFNITRALEEQNSNDDSLIVIDEPTVDKEIQNTLKEMHETGNSHFVGCQGLESLKESTWINSMLLELFTAHSNIEKAKGMLRLEGRKDMIGVTLFEYENGDSFFQKKETLARLLRMQNWPGIPRVYAACARSANQKDVCKSSSPTQIHFISYIVERFDQDLSLCNPSVENDCKELSALNKRISKQDNPQKTALFLLKNIAEVFNNLYQKGILLFGFEPTQMIVTKTFEVKLVNVDHFYFLPVRSIQQNTYQKFMSNVICLLAPMCHSHDLLHKEKFFNEYGQNCEELIGMCDPYSNKCHGIDAQLYVCLFSKLLFRNILSEAVMKGHSGLEALKVCTSEESPNVRCSWKAIKVTLERFVDAENIN